MAAQKFLEQVAEIRANNYLFECLQQQKVKYHPFNSKSTPPVPLNFFIRIHPFGKKNIS